MDFMNQTVASTIVKYFTWLFDNDGILDITHAFISYNVLVFGIIVISFFYNIFFLKYTLGKAILFFVLISLIYLIFIFPIFYLIFMIVPNCQIN